MPRFPLLTLLVLILGNISPVRSQDAHLSEKGSSAIFLRSAFAHGYRHGYEDGYHLGNLDINMGRPARAQKSQFTGLNPGYSSVFGPKRSFEDGFHAGARAGYFDGFAGRRFRAVDSMRAIAAGLDADEGTLAGAPAAGLSFNQGLASGYRDGLERQDEVRRPSPPLDFHNVGCAQLSSGKKADAAAQESYCNGYRRGFVLGHDDAEALGTARMALEASK